MDERDYEEYERDRRRKLAFIIGGAVLAVICAAVALSLVFGGSGGKKNYQKYYDAAEAAFLSRDYTAALEQLDKAMEIDATEECYLLMADVYYARGDTERAIQVLYLGYSRVGGSALSEMLNRLKDEGEPLPSAAPVPAEGVSVGGKSFPAGTTAVVLSGKRLGNADLEALCALTELESLSLSDNNISDIGPVSALTSLTSLQLSNNAVSDLTPLSDLSGLKTLYLDGNPIRDLSPLYGLQSLRTLSMKNVGVSSRELSALENALPNCNVFSDSGAEDAEELSLGGLSFRADVTELDLSGMGLRDISVLRACRDLVKLDLRDNEIEDISPLVELQDLEWLCLWNNQVKDITPLMSLSHLRYLDADGNRVRDLTALEYLTELEELWVSNNSLRSFQVLGRLKGLERLGLKNTGLTDEALSLLSGLTELEELDIQENPALTWDAVRTLEQALPGCEISHGELLYTVKLGGETFTSDAETISVPGKGIESLSGLERFKALRYLDLDGNNISDFTPLFGLRQLERLSVRGMNLTEDTLRELQERLPDCVILADKTVDAEEGETPADGGQEDGGQESGRQEDGDGAGETPAPSPDAELSDTQKAEYAAIGSGAALAAAGSGSGYAILWDDTDNVSRSIRSGLASGASSLGMNMLYDGSFSGSKADFGPYLAHLQSTGVDVVFFVAGDTAMASALSAAGSLGYAPRFIQVYG